MTASIPPPADGASSRPSLYHLMLFEHGEDDFIDRDLVQKIQATLAATIKSKPETTHIDLWLESPGGDAHAAYKLILDLRSRCSYLRVIIPDYAKSAATLIALGADELLMAAAAELGPLDAQLEHPDRENEIVSALDLANSLGFLGRSALDIAISGGPAIIRAVGLPRASVIGAVLDFASQLFAPAVGKLDPLLLHKATNELRVAERYAIAMLSSRRSSGTVPIRPRPKPDTLVKKFIKDFPTHGYVISKDEAIKAGLEVGAAEQHPRWGQIFDLYKRTVETKSTVHLVLSDEDLPKLAPEVAKPHDGADGAVVPQPDGSPTDGAAKQADPERAAGAPS